jgi:hypothetical protein
MGAAAGYYHQAGATAYLIDPAGTYCPGGASAPTTDPAGAYSGAGARAPTLAAAGGSIPITGATLAAVEIVHPAGAYALASVSAATTDPAGPDAGAGASAATTDPADGPGAAGASAPTLAARGAYIPEATSAAAQIVSPPGLTSLLARPRRSPTR